jgi:hypothetical protein
MTETNPRHWYALISASPRPEAGEAVNVGVLYGNGAPVHLDYVEQLPRLVGLVAPEELYLFRGILSAIAERVETGADLPTLRSTIGPQLRISPPHELFKAPSEQVFSLLRHRYLTTPTAREALREETRLVQRSEKRLDRLLGGVVRFGLDIVEDVTFDKLYASKREELPTVRVPRLARAFRGHARDLLVDGVLIEAQTADFAVRSATTRVSRAFWYYDRLRQAIQTVDGREIRTVGVLLTRPKEHAPEVIEARDYIRHVWERDALVVDSSQPDGQDVLREQMVWAVSR